MVVLSIAVNLLKPFLFFELVTYIPNRYDMTHINVDSYLLCYNR